MNIGPGAEKQPLSRRVARAAGESESSLPPRRDHILVVDDEEVLRDSLRCFLEDQGYEVSLAVDGGAALERLDADALPDLILLDLGMPGMDGWQFRLRQKDHPKLGRIPVVALSADDSPQAAAISAHAYLRKPVDPQDLLSTIDRVLLETRRRELARLTETERLASLGRLAAGVGHEINNPLAFVLLNLDESIKALGTVVKAMEAFERLPSSLEVAQLSATLADVGSMLQDSRVGADRIKKTTAHLRALSRQVEPRRELIDVNVLLEQSSSVAWNQIRHRAALTKLLGENLPPVLGDDTSLAQLFLNLLMNAAQAIPEGDAEGNKIEIVTKLAAEAPVPEIVIEIRDTGVGIAPGLVSHVFEPFFTTKPVGQGTGLGLSLSRQTVLDHGGRITLESEVGVGTVFRVFLPAAATIKTTDIPSVSFTRVGVAVEGSVQRGRILVIDDEPLIGRIIHRALNDQHDVSFFEHAADAMRLLERGEAFDLVMCDLVMPDLSGPEFHDILSARWPHLLARTIFMTGGAFTPATVAFVDRVSPSLLSKPFDLDLLKDLVSARVQS